MCMKIKCEDRNETTDAFYLVTDDEKIWLFDQVKRKGVTDYFKRGVTINRALRPQKGKRFDAKLGKTVDKLPLYLRYVEKEYGIQIMKGRD